MRMKTEWMITSDLSDIVVLGSSRVVCYDEWDWLYSPVKLLCWNMSEVACVKATW